MKTLKQNQLKLAWGIVASLFLVGGLLASRPMSVSAQATATFTPTATATSAATATATPLATMLPVAVNGGVPYIGQRIGGYGIATPSTAGSAFQSNIGSIDLYASTGRQTFHADNATGNLTLYGSLSSNNCSTVTVTNSATVVPPTGLTPTSGQVSLQTITGDASRPAILANTGGVTITVFNSALTPVANATPAVVNYCVFGTR